MKVLSQFVSKVFCPVPALLLMFFLLSCDRYPKAVNEVLVRAGKNRAELEKVITHYRNQHDREKLKAAYFLIGNMGDKFALDGNAVRKYDVLFDILDSLHKKKLIIDSGSPILKRNWDSLWVLYGHPSMKAAEELPDYLHVTSAFLIENIDRAFEARNNSAYGRRLTFEEFCEYILPYRLGTERLEAWRSTLASGFKELKDTLQAANDFEVAGAMNRYIATYMQINRIVSSYPFDIPVSKMQKGRRGSCPHLVNYVTLAMRANGLPVGVDYAPLWGNFSRGHTWNVILTDSGTCFPFDAVRPLFGRSHTFYKISKAYRNMFALQPSELPEDTEDVPQRFLDRHRIDVTEDYASTYDITVPRKYSHPGKKNYAVICTFNNRNWIPQDWGRIHDDGISFKKIGSDIAYIVMYYDEAVLTPATDPFILQKDGSIRYLIPADNEQQRMYLLRKFPFYFNNTNLHAESMLGVRFQGANKADFSDAVDLFTIRELPTKVERAVISNPSRFRFIRYLSAPSKKGNVAELEFYGEGRRRQDTVKLHGKIVGFPKVSSEWESYYSNAFDGNLETYFDSVIDGPAWTGLELEKPERITKIVYCPRSDTNFILVNDAYELYVWKHGAWFSLGNQIAGKQYLEYTNVPAHGLYLLRDLSRGVEERIFTYEDGNQVWW